MSLLWICMCLTCFIRRFPSSRKPPQRCSADPNALSSLLEGKHGLLNVPYPSQQPKLVSYRHDVFVGTWPEMTSPVFLYCLCPTSLLYVLLSAWNLSHVVLEVAGFVSSQRFWCYCVTKATQGTRLQSPHPPAQTFISCHWHALFQGRVLNSPDSLHRSLRTKGCSINSLCPTDQVASSLNLFSDRLSDLCSMAEHLC